METARNTDLPDLLSSLGYTVKRIGSYYTTAEMDSLRIKNRRTWRRYSNNQHGDAITFLQEFCGKSFPEAVDYLLAFHGRSRDSPDRDKSIPRLKSIPKEEAPVFTLPPAHTDQRRVFAYLRKRGIAAPVIRAFIDAGLLYEDAEHHNCVFVGKDSAGKAVFAAKRGTCDWNGSSFRGGVPGSDKEIGFRLPCDPKIGEVFVFEAPIDLMSFCTLCREVTSNAVALCGLYSGPLDTYLRENPHLKHITLLLDGDEPGINAAKELRDHYSAKGYEVEIRVPRFGKDWNEQLVYKLTGKLPETTKQQKKPKKEANKPMADLEKMINDKAADDAQWREQRKKDQEYAATLRDAGVADITTDPEVYARYLDMQGDNPAYGAGSIAIVMMRDPGATVFRTADRWKAMGRTVLEEVQEETARVFTRAPSGRGYNLTPVYDIAQTQGRELRKPQLLDDSREMEAALASLLKFSPVEVAADKELDTAARYDPQAMKLSVNPSYSDSQVFAAVAAQIAHARFHDRGFNRYYSQENYELSAQSVSYILCRRFGIEREQPDATRLPELYQGCGIEERWESLKSIQSMSRQIGRAIDKAIAPPQRSAPVRRGEAR